MSCGIMRHPAAFGNGQLVTGSNLHAVNSSRVNSTRGQLVTWLVFCESQLVTPVIVT